MKTPAFVFLHIHCECGGKIYRHWAQVRRGADGDEVLCTDVEDRCEACGRVYAESSYIPSPCAEIGELFEQWNVGGMQKDEFDQNLARILLKVGGAWKKVS